MVRVGLLWHSVNSENLGVGALTVSNIAIVEKVAAELNQKVSFTILGWTDRNPTQLDRHNVFIYKMRARDLIRPHGLYSRVRECDFVLDISAGDSFADIYGSRRFVFNTLSKMVVFLARKPLILSPQTIGPFKQVWTKYVAYLLMRFSTAVITRDGLSTEYVKQFKFTHVSEATDVAFRLPYEISLKPKVKRIKVGINLSGWLFIGGQNQDNMVVLKSDYPVFVRSLVSHFAKLEECEVHLISHVIGGTQDDYRASLQLGEEFPGAIVAPRFTDPSAVKSYISGMDFFCGSRMHACIAAFSSGVPVVPIAYSRKFSGLFGSLGYHESTDLLTQTGSEILEHVIAGYNDRESLKQKVTRSLEAVDAKLAKYEEILKNQFRVLQR
jgi:colanic acid/amylovoran biosynthesis protein